MTQRSRHLLFTAEPDRPGPGEDDVFPSEVRPSVVRMLWLGLFAVLVLLAVIVLVWRAGGV